LYIYSCLPITFDSINSELFYLDSFYDSVMVYVSNFKRAINSTIGPVSNSAKLHRDTNTRRVRLLIFFSIGIVTACTASDVTEHVLNYGFLRSVRSSWIDVDLCANVEVAFSDRIAGRNTRIPFRLPNDLYPDESHGAHHHAAFYHCRT